MAINIEAPDEIFRRCAMAAMLIKPGDALLMRLREFGMLVTDECTEAVRGFKDGSQRDAGDAIREIFGE
ncbi:hypothetical protein [Variovorax ginsengisoli]|uniref:Uncharacterized protein n=1 Tax=Variovorax ginsengisoli TaxID=363844 RepID=A0ABT8SGV2_9BURK|nr:hypothetical protein [Variovorax ginsengisoli]MDN8618790.1 hypothetical protein [Variovorax ginsengisoli]MDO1537960.1 hypothetical protein [Variovorax ginsengisoli]